MVLFPLLELESISSSLGFPQTALTFCAGRSAALQSPAVISHGWFLCYLFPSRHPAWSKQPGCDCPCCHREIVVLQPLLLTPFWVSACPQTQREAPGAPRTWEAQEIRPNISVSKSARPVCSPRCLLHPQAPGRPCFPSGSPLATEPSRFVQDGLSLLHKPPPARPAHFRGTIFLFAPLFSSSGHSAEAGGTRAAPKVASLAFFSPFPSVGSRARRGGHRGTREGRSRGHRNGARESGGD